MPDVALNQAGNATRSDVCIPRELLQSLSRELDRFFVALTQIEQTSVEIINGPGSESSPQISRCFQNVDYLSQASVALSAVLSQLAVDGSGDIDTFLAHLAPTDLSERLMNQNLSDIDNTKNKMELF